MIGARLSVEAIRDSLGVDSLGYLSLEGMHAAMREVAGSQVSFCDACFSGEYPTPLTDLERGYTVGTRC